MSYIIVILCVLLAGCLDSKETKEKLLFEPGINYLVITVDVEANPRRQLGDHVNRLIYGAFDEGRAGIIEMMDAADEYGVKITFFLDVLEAFYYPGEIEKVALDIYNRGHDLQMHSHPEFISDEQWLSIMNKNWRSNTWSYEEADIMFSLMLEFFSVLNLPDPIAYRAGSYMYNSNTIKVLKDKGLKISSNYNEFSDEGRQPDGWGHQSVFYWDNDILEFPITYSPESCGEIIKSQDRIDETYYEDLENPWDKIRNNSTCFGDVKISTMILHSWSLLYREEVENSDTDHFFYRGGRKLELLREFLAAMPDDFKVISMLELSAMLSLDEEIKTIALSDIIH